MAARHSNLATLAFSTIRIQMTGDIKMSDAAQNWEYTTLKLGAKDWFLAGSLDQSLFDSRLNQLGKDGWELVSVFDTSIIKDATGEIVTVLKRPRRNQPHDTQLYLRTLLPDNDGQGKLICLDGSVAQNTKEKWWFG